MKSKWVKGLALGMAAAMTVTTLAGCGGSSNNAATDDAQQADASSNTADDTAADTAGDTADDTDTASDSSANAGEASVSEADESTSFSWLIDTQPEASLYEEYEDNPIYKYWANMAWDADGDGAAKKISIDFSSPVAGAERDTVNTLIATEEYPDILSTSYVSSSTAELYESGIALDLTEYVNNYMPNYKVWIAENPAYARLMTNHVDGEDRYIQIYGVSDQAGEMWGGLVYRRDWIVKYGENPETGEAFSGEWEESEYGNNWVDDVVFPSGNTDPTTISDWEWMLEIFATAIEDQGITDGYAMTLPYCGFYQMGDLVSGFGAGPLWYLDEKSVAHFGADSDAMRAYIECMSTWYKNGWIDPSFDERANDMFFQIDTASVYSGMVGAWYGMSSQLGDLMDTSNGDTSNYTNGIVVFGAPQPINDVYGSSSEQNVTPFCFYGNTLTAGSVVITNKAEDKDIATLCAAIDYLYSHEGGLLKSRGFSDVQMAEVQDEFYLAHHLDNGYYTVSVDEDGTEIYNLNSERDAEDGLADAAILNRASGMNINKNVNPGNPEYRQNSVDLWVTYSDYGFVTGSVTGQWDSETAETTTAIQNNITTYMSQAVADFVAGRADVTDDKAWQSYCDELAVYEPEVYTDAVNEVLGNN